MRVSSALIALSTLLPLAASSYVPSERCKSNEFWWDDKKCCLPYGGPNSPPQPPKSTYCPPSGYYWHKDKGCCAPKNPPQPNHPEPQCGKGHNWYQSLHYCVPEPHHTTTSTYHKPSPTPYYPYGGYHGSQHGGKGSYGDKGSGKDGESNKGHGYSGRSGDF
ncbi:hypothetical protein Agabi119p4_1195 [Agaricus bisporus var. burnettii]|uniref:Uncharacterized protein n=1 Tax=Agaricus bisporus var. burnettii TaxID=192524 RepID=A0A8H7FCD2_AGABI|nr:hypothetical protein Agabi119p4_1195 [Agaricus bisporus var. burnettii]